MATTTTKKHAVSGVGARSSPVLIDTPMIVATTTHRTSEPPTSTAWRRAVSPPRRQRATPASATNASRSKLLTCGTMNHGLRSPTGAETAAPQSTVCDNPVICSCRTDAPAS